MNSSRVKRTIAYMRKIVIVVKRTNCIILYLLIIGLRSCRVGRNLKVRIVRGAHCSSTKREVVLRIGKGEFIGDDKRFLRKGRGENC
jgi:hypothetical protein